MRKVTFAFHQNDRNSKHFSQSRTCDADDTARPIWRGEHTCSASATKAFFNSCRCSIDDQSFNLLAAIIEFLKVGRHLLCGSKKRCSIAALLRNRWKSKQCHRIKWTTQSTTCIDDRGDAKRNPLRINTIIRADASLACQREQSWQSTVGNSCSAKSCDQTIFSAKRNHIRYGAECGKRKRFHQQFTKYCRHSIAAAPCTTECPSNFPSNCRATEFCRTTTEPRMRDCIHIWQDTAGKHRVMICDE